MKLVRTAAALLALCLAPALAASAQATIVTFNLAGNWEPAPHTNQPGDVFTGTITYDTASLSYTNPPFNTLYGVSGGAPAGSYAMSWSGGSYQGSIRTIGVQQLGECMGPGSGPCVALDMRVESTLYSYVDGRFYVLLNNAAPFDTIFLPDEAPSSDKARYAFLQMPQLDTAGRFTSLGYNPVGINAQPGASLRLGSALAVPEPANWAMMILGFGVIGSTARRRRAIASPAA